MVEHLNDGEAAGTEEQTHEAAKLRQQREERERLLHVDLSVRHALVEDVQLSNVIPVAKLKYHYYEYGSV